MRETLRSAECTFPREKWQGYEADYSPHLVPKSRMVEQWGIHFNGMILPFIDVQGRCEEK
jgi:hypothetical protein